MQQLDDNDSACPDCGCRSALVAGGNWPSNGIAVVCVGCRSARIGRLVREPDKIDEMYPSDQDATVLVLPFLPDARPIAFGLGYRLQL